MMAGRLNITNADLPGVLLIEPPTIFEDFRGHYVEIWNKCLYEEAGATHNFVTDDISVSRRGVLRGIHGDDKTWKLVSCLWGCFYLVVVCMDQQKKVYKQWRAFTLSAHNRLQVLIPPNYGNGYLVLSDWAIFHYKQSQYYDRANQFTLKWNDPSLDIYWPIGEPILSERDR